MCAWLTHSLCRVVCLQFPDPWHAKHGKRRVMSSAFAAQIAALLPARGLFYFCSDHAAIAWHIRECILSTGWFDALSGVAQYDLTSIHYLGLSYMCFLRGDRWRNCVAGGE